MRLNVQHSTLYTYQPAAARVALRLKLFPTSFSGQTVVTWKVMLNGVPQEPLLTDAFGDSVAVWHAHNGCETLEVCAEGTIETVDRSGIIGQLGKAKHAAVFLRHTSLTTPRDRISEFAANVEGDTTLDRMHALSRAVHDEIAYRPGATTGTTTAEEALATGSGVCQDHAHVFIAAARSLRIPARYVTGYLFVGNDAEALVETHAWAEAHVEDIGWVAFDASNGICATENYVRLCSGLDADHAAPIRGSVNGGGEMELTARVDIAEAQESAQQ
ncbi:MAG: transglutaminase family protein [Pseudomonadota bacterium]